MFAYEDGNRQYLPRKEKRAHKKIKLPDSIWNKKYKIITEIYGFNKESFEPKATPTTEAFWCFDSSRKYHDWFVNRKIALNENHCAI